MKHETQSTTDQRDRIEPPAPRSPRTFWYARRGSHFLAVLAGGAALGWLASMGCATHTKGPDFALMAEAWKLMNKEYVDRAALKPEELTYGAIAGMVDSLG